jgi:nascent polypeptide-associated complex subunit alpha
MKRAKLDMEELADVEKVVFHYRDGRVTAIYNPLITKIRVSNQTTYQIIGEEEEVDEGPSIELSEEDIQIVMEQAGVDKATATKVLEMTKGDIAEAIMLLKEGASP